MAGLVPAIHAFTSFPSLKDVDARHKACARTGEAGPECRAGRIYLIARTKRLLLAALHAAELGEYILGVDRLLAVVLRR
jgi:hypothetical protein